MTDRRKQALIEMANRGTPEEQRIASKIISDNGIDSIIDYPDYVEFEAVSHYEKRLLCQIHAMVVDSKKPDTFAKKRYKNILVFKVTKSQKDEIGLVYSLMKRELESELSITYSAFVQRNHIFPDCDIKNPSDRKLTDADRKAMSRSTEMDKVHIRKQIT